jgi:hypothetical protein
LLRIRLPTLKIDHTRGIPAQIVGDARDRGPSLYERQRRIIPFLTDIVMSGIKGRAAKTNFPIFRCSRG